MCKNSDAFVQGGMNFSHSEQKLSVPVCGIYEIWSQIQFQNDTNTSSYVFHRVEIERNCGDDVDNSALFRSHAGLPAHPVVSKASTTNLAIVKMCAGGTVSVVIPTLSGCCGYGDKSSTYFSVQLTSEVSCDSIN